MKSMSEFYKMKSEYLKKHGGLEKVDTSTMDEYGRYHKEYFAADGSMLYEVNGPVWMDVEFTADVHGVTIRKVEKCKFFQTEAWTSTDARSEYYIEKW